MAINLNAISSFSVPSLAERETKAKFRKQQALFYTIRYLQWQVVKSQVFRNAIAEGTLTPIAPGYRDGDNWVRPEYDPDEVAEVFKQAQTEFNAAFDKAFINATAEELVDYGLKYFGMTEQQLLKLNAERSAERFGR